MSYESIFPLDLMIAVVWLKINHVEQVLYSSVLIVAFFYVLDIVLILFTIMNKPKYVKNIFNLNLTFQW